MAEPVNLKMRLRFTTILLREITLEEYLAYKHAMGPRFTDWATLERTGQVSSFFGDRGQKVHVFMRLLRIDAEPEPSPPPADTGWPFVPPIPLADP
jgi:hypothetical protein